MREKKDLGTLVNNIFGKRNLSISDSSEGQFESLLQALTTISIRNETLCNKSTKGSNVHWNSNGQVRGNLLHSSLTVKKVKICLEDGSILTLF